MKNAFCCSLLLVLVLGAYFRLSFAAFCCFLLLFVVCFCFEIQSVLSQKSKQANAFGCSFLLFVAHSCFL